MKLLLTLIVCNMVLMVSFFTPFLWSLPKGLPEGVIMRSLTSVVPQLRLIFPQGINRRSQNRILKYLPLPCILTCLTFADGHRWNSRTKTRLNHWCSQRRRTKCGRCCQRFETFTPNFWNTYLIKIFASSDTAKDAKYKAAEAVDNTKEAVGDAASAVGGVVQGKNFLVIFFKANLLKKIVFQTLVKELPTLLLPWKTKQGISLWASRMV